MAAPKKEIKKEEPQKPLETPKAEAKQTKTKVKIATLLRGSYGAFNAGDVVEIDSKLADFFIKSRLATEVK